jgi:hypothetical protein
MQQYSICLREREQRQTIVGVFHLIEKGLLKSNFDGMMTSSIGYNRAMEASGIDMVYRVTRSFYDLAFRP